MTHQSGGYNWAELVQDHTAGLFRLALQMLGDRQEAQDVVQETFLRAYVALEQKGLTVHTSTRAWLAKISVNLCYDRLRRKSWQEMPIDLDSNPAAAMPVGAGAGAATEWLGGSDEGPEQAAIRCDEAAIVRRHLSALPPNHRATVVLRYAQDLSYKEIAAVMGVPENTVATWLRRAHIALRRRLEQEEDGS